MTLFLTQLLKRFRKSEDGVAVVEFVLSVPLMILVFAIVIEFSRLFLGYQATVSGVRDANRYLARVAPIDICIAGGSLSAYDAILKTMIEKDRSANSVLPSQFTVTSVAATHTCVSGVYRTSPAPVATVSAQISVQFPMGFVFGMFGTELTPLTTTVTNSSRIFGS
ncbi:MAG: Flp pilus assembly protein TadG [Reinekea sp.]|jgi:Flp pilus assembly protein TadG